MIGSTTPNFAMENDNKNDDGDYRIRRVKNVLHDLDNNSVRRISDTAARRILEGLTDLLSTAFRLNAETISRKISKKTAQTIINSYENTIELDNLIKKLTKASDKLVVTEDVESIFRDYLRGASDNNPEIFDYGYKTVVFDKKEILAIIAPPSGIKGWKNDVLEYIMSIIYNITKLILKIASDRAIFGGNTLIRSSDIEYAFDSVVY